MNLPCEIYLQIFDLLNKLTIGNCAYSLSALTSSYGGILSYLSQFRKLTGLIYCNNTEHYTTIYEIQAACPSLTSIAINDYYSTPSFRAAEYLPESVERLCIRIQDIDVNDWMNDVSVNNTLKLMERMNKLPDASLHWTPDKEYETEHENNGESDMTIFFKILKAFKGNKKASCASFSDFRSVHNSMHFSGEDLHFHYGLNYADLYNERVLEFAIPDKTVSVIGPEIISNLEFYIYTELTFKLLQYSLTNCPNLQHVEYKGMSSPCHEFRLPSTLNKYKRL
ncbi:hypothetical protein BDF21DRAFT_486895 [Thamnidium elegans]|nr:hypothetical protein BDF21DRAFT_486895 [Thamnidium elegans]